MDNVESVVPIASDHGGFEMKSYIIGRLMEDGHEVRDYGVMSPESVDYPDFIHPLSKDIDEGKYRLGIIICGSGNGAQMVANKYPGVRAALCWNEEITRLARQHNDANILSLPGRFIAPELGYALVKIFLATEVEGGKHAKQIEKIPIR